MLPKYLTNHLRFHHTLWYVSNQRSARADAKTGNPTITHIRESPPQFENRIMTLVYVRSITRSTVYQKLYFVSRNWRMEISSVACEFSSIKFDYFDYPKSLISRTNEVYVFSIKYRYSDILLKKHKLHLSPLFCCNHTCYCVNMVS